MADLKPFRRLTESGCTFHCTIGIGVVVEPHAVDDLTSLLALPTGSANIRVYGCRTGIAHKTVVELRIYPQASVGNQKRQVNVVPFYGLKQQLRCN